MPIVNPITCVICLLKEGFIDGDDAWLLLNAHGTPLWGDKADRLFNAYGWDLHHGVPEGDAVRHIHRLLNDLYGQKFY